MDQTHPCPMTKCDGQMHKSTGRSNRWFCDNCWFTLPNSFFIMEEERRRLFLDERLAKYRKELVARRHKEVVAAIVTLANVTLADDDPEIARILAPLRTRLFGG